MEFSPCEEINNSYYHLCCLFHVLGIELGMLFTLFLTLKATLIIYIGSHFTDFID